MLKSKNTLAHARVLFANNTRFAYIIYCVKCSNVHKIIKTKSLPLKDPCIFFRSWLNETSMPIIMDEVQCSHTDVTLSMCYKRIMRHNCDYDDRIWLRCYNETGTNIMIVQCTVLDSTAELHQHIYFISLF